LTDCAPVFITNSLHLLFYQKQPHLSFDQAGYKFLQEFIWFKHWSEEHLLFFLFFNQICSWHTWYFYQYFLLWPGTYPSS